MKGFLSFKFSGEDINELIPILENIRRTMKDIWFSDVFCSLFLEDFFNKQWLTIQQRYDYCLRQMYSRDFIVCFIHSPDPSRGMFGELEKAKKHKQKILLLIKKWLEKDHPSFIDAARHTIQFETIDWLVDTLGKLDINALHTDNGKI